MAIRIESEFMVLEVNGAVVATARFSQYAAADGNGDNDPFVRCWRAELFL
jgi:hypothetical protein